MFESMTSTEVLSALFGLYFLSAGIGLVLDRHSVLGILNGMIDNPALGYLAGLIAFLIGAIVVSFHNQWGSALETLISVFGWAALIEGVLILSFRKWFLNFFAFTTGFQAIVVPYGILAIAMGVAFLIAGLDIYVAPLQ